LKAATDSPYIAGVSDDVRCVGMIMASALPTKNRLAFLTLDSVLEIALRVFLKHKKKITLDPVKHRPRAILLSIAEKNMSVDHSVWEQISYYYEDIRCPLYHQASDMTVTQPILDDFVETVLFLFKEMFSMDARTFISEGTSILSAVNDVSTDNDKIDTDSLSKMDKVVLALGTKPLPSAKAIIDTIRSMGVAGDLTTNTISIYLSRGRYFYWSEEESLWKLTELVGKRRFSELTRPKE